MASLTGDEVRRLSYALDELTRIKKELGVDVRAYGDIDVEVSGKPGMYLRLTWNTEQECYAIAEQHR